MGWMCAGVVVLSSKGVGLRVLDFVAGHWFGERVLRDRDATCEREWCLWLKVNWCSARLRLLPRVRSWKLTSPRAWPRKGASMDEGPNMCTLDTYLQTFDSIL